MPGHRPRKTGSVTFSPAHPKCVETHFLPAEYVEDFVAENEADAGTSFAAVRKVNVGQAPRPDLSMPAV